MSLPERPYLEHLAGLDYGRGWQFWALAGAIGRAKVGTEWVVLRRGDELREACVDVETGAIRRWGSEG